MTGQGELLTVAEAAQTLRVSTTTMRRWLRLGRLPSYKIGRQSIRIRRENLDRVVRPAQPTAGPAEKETPKSSIRRLTEEEVRRGYEALEASRRLLERMRARRGGQPFAESWPMIREAREERSRQLL
ncbi:MAG: helix-turn-helix domain-containing protein [Dehalococcoidia bacterium]